MICSFIIWYTSIYLLSTSLWRLTSRSTIFLLYCKVFIIYMYPLDGSEIPEFSVKWKLKLSYKLNSAIFFKEIKSLQWIYNDKNVYIYFIFLEIFVKILFYSIFRPDQNCIYGKSYNNLFIICLIWYAPLSSGTHQFIFCPRLYGA
jgi:hypothetical protein